jgi:hypothetical protein
MSVAPVMPALRNFLRLQLRVAKWYIFVPKNQHFWYILQTFGIFRSYLVYAMAVWYILWTFGVRFPHFGIFYRRKSGNPAPASERLITWRADLDGSRRLTIGMQRKESLTCTLASSVTGSGEISGIGEFCLPILLARVPNFKPLLTRLQFIFLYVLI